MNKRKIFHKCPICKKEKIEDLMKHKAQVHKDEHAAQVIAELEELD